MKSRRRLAAGLMALGVLVSCVPIAMSVYFARQQAEREKFVALDSVAKSIGLQMNQSHQYLNAVASALAGKANPCSADNIAWMQRFQIDSYGVKSVVVVKDGRIQCSSSGESLTGLELGAPDFRQPNGSELFIDVDIPGTSAFNFAVIERQGVGILMFPFGLIRPYANTGMAVGIFTGSVQHSVKHGPLHPNWVVPMAQGVSSDQIVDKANGYFVVRHRPSSGVSTVYAAIALSEVDARAAQLRNWFMPIGLLVAFLLLGGAYLLTRHKLSPHTRVLDMVRRNQLFLVYQPVIDLQDNNACIGAEALVRWREDDGTVLTPDTFIHFAQEAGLVHLITERVMQLIAEDLTDFLRANPGFRIGMNLAPSDLQCPGVITALDTLIATLGQGNGRLLVEITEQGLLDEKSALETMQAIGTRGVDIAIDDFGTGYSSLAYLSTYPFNLLKIDRTFVAAACTDAVNSKIAGHIIELGRTVEMEVLAEGIETEQEAALFRRWGVDFGQGYLFAKPMPAAELMAYYAAHPPTDPNFTPI